MTNLFGHRLVCGAIVGLVTAGLPAAGTAQERGTAVVGTVSNAASGEPLVGVRIAIQDREETTLTDEWGEFQFVNLPEGQHALVLRKDGFLSRGFRLNLSPENMGEEIYLGVFALEPAATPMVATAPPSDNTFWGRTVDGITGEPIAGVIVGREQRAVRVTGADGEFRIGNLTAGRHVFQFRRIGYRPIDQIIMLGGPQAEEAIPITLQPLPVEVDAIVVEGERTIFAFGRMAGFYRRRQQGLGTTFTREEIAVRNPTYVSDLLLRVPSVRLLPRSEGGSLVEIRNCGRPNIYLNGVPIAVGVDLDDLISRDNLEAVEVYEGARIPAEFMSAVAGNRAGGIAPCGVIVLWTR